MSFRTHRVYLFCICIQLILVNPLRAEGIDSIFISGVKNFVNREIGINLKSDLYTAYDSSNLPMYYVYISRADRIAKPDELNSFFIYCGHSETHALSIDSFYSSKGCQAFCYHAYANSSTVINERFMSYPEEARVFIMIHELMHNYIEEMKLKIPYEFNEALSDVVGNFGAMKYARETNKLTNASWELQTTLNEKVYSCLNKFIRKINRRPARQAKYFKSCREKLNTQLKNGNTFQRDRFNYDVNNAFLLKNSFYSKNYFLLKKVMIRQGTILKFLEVIKGMPSDKDAATRYLEKYS